MSSQSDLAAIKRQVFTAISKVSGVAGVGLPAQGLTIYLETDSPEVRASIERALAPPQGTRADSLASDGQISGALIGLAGETTSAIVLISGTLDERTARMVIQRRYEAGCG